MAVPMSESTVTLNSTIPEDGVQGTKEKAPVEVTDDPPAVFICSKCKRPIGDTFGWMGSDIEGHSILLKAVTDYVSVEKKQLVSNVAHDYGCTFENLSCSGCSTVIGKIYRCTPKHLDFKRDLFCLSVHAMDSYTLGSANKQAIPDCEEPVTLGVRAVLEEEIEKTKTVLNVLQSRVSSIEAQIFHFKGVNNNQELEHTELAEKSGTMKKS